MTINENDPVEDHLLILETIADAPDHIWCVTREFSWFLPLSFDFIIPSAKSFCRKVQEKPHLII
jgi:hypothetical protein